MMNNPYSGGWRFGDRPTSVEALYQGNSGISPDFLKQVAALAQDPSKQGLLDQAVTAKPLQGLIDAPGSTGWGGDSQQGPSQSASDRSGYNTNSAPVSGGLLSAALTPLGLGAIGPLAANAINSMTRNGFDPTKGAITDPSLAFGSAAWADAVNANAAARAAREAGVGAVYGGPGGGWGNDSTGATGSAGDAFGGYGGFGAGDYGDGTDR